LLARLREMTDAELQTGIDAHEG